MISIPWLVVATPTQQLQECTNALLAAHMTNNTVLSLLSLLSLQDPLLQHGWKTGAIIPELEDEIAQADKQDFKENLAEVLTVENLLQKRQVSKINNR